MFRLGKDRYVLEASHVVEVLPFLEIKKIPQAPRGVAGLINYRGQPVPAVDLSQLTLDQPASERLSTRIIVVNYRDSAGKNLLLGLITEHATEMIRRESRDFVDSGVNLVAAPYLGPVLMDGSEPIQWILEQRLLPEQVRDVLFSETLSQA